MKAQFNGKKNFVAFFQQINKSSKKKFGKRIAALPRADMKIMEQLNFDNVAYLSDN